MKPELIKPIPKYMIKLIKEKDLELCREQDGHVRFYAYLTKNDGELVKMTVAVRNKYKKWYCKQVAMHGIHSERCYLKDIIFYYIAGYIVGWHSEGLTKESKWFEDGEWGWNDDNLFDPHAPIINKEYLTKIPKYKYAAWDCYKKVNILQYLRLYEKYPQTEYVLKLGLNNYVESTMFLEKLGKDKQFRKWVINNAFDLRTTNYYIATIMKAYKQNKPVEEIQIVEKAKKALRYDDHYKTLKDCVNNDKERFYAYLAKHRTNISTYNDYLTACNYLHLNMDEEKNRYPHDFKRWHDIRMDEYHTKVAIADEKKRKALYKQFANVAQKYLALQNYTKGDYAIFIAQSPADLIREGEVLHHCVGKMNYDQKMVREETLIFFVRNKDNPNTPFVTLEYSLLSNQVLQCYGERDSLPAAEVSEFVTTKWLPYANRQIKKLQLAA